MKKLLLTTFAVLLSLSLFGRSKERVENPSIIDARISYAILDYLRDEGYTVLPEVHVVAYRNPQDTIKKSNYEKYWESKNGQLEKPRHDPKPEFDDLYYQPSKDRNDMREKPKKDTIEKKQIVVNNYYSDNDFYFANRINRFHHSFWFDYYSPFYSPYYSWNSPYFYDSWYWGYNSWYGWNFSFGWHSPYYSWNSPYNYGWHTPYYGYNQPKYNNVQYGRRERPSNYTQTIPSRRTTATQTQTRTISQTRTATSPQDRPTYDQNRRTYAPSYEHPRMSVRPQYNNTKTGNGNTRTQISTETRTQTRIITQPNVQRSTESRTINRGQNYSAPSRSYSAPVQRSSNYNSSSMDRRSSGDFNGGSNMNRSSVSSGSNSSSGSGSSGGRTSGGSTSSGRR